MCALAHAAMELRKTVTTLHRVFATPPSGGFGCNAHPLHRRPRTVTLAEPLQNVDRLNAREGRPSTARSDRDDPDDAEDFRASFAQARSRGETELIVGGLRDEDVDTSMAKFLLASSFDYTKAEKHEVEMDADINSEKDINLDDESKEILRETLRRRRGQ